MKNKIKLGLIVALLVMTGCAQKESIEYGDTTDPISEEESGKILSESYFLPVGTVVILKNSGQKVIISRHFPERYGIENHLYSGVDYSQGYRDEGGEFFFNADAIESIVHLGYVDEEHLKNEEYLNEIDIEVEGKSIFNDDYVGLQAYKDKPLSKTESDKIKSEFEYLPIGTTLVYDESETIVITGYFVLSGGVNKEKVAHLYVGHLSSPEDYSEKNTRMVRMEYLENQDILKLGYVGEEYYQIVEEIEKAIADNKAELENPTSTPEEEIVRDNPVKLMFEQEGILTELEIYHEDGKVLRHEVTTTATYEGIIQKREEVSNKEEVKRFFAEVKAVFDETAGVEYTVNYEGEILIEYIVFNYAELAPEIGLSLPGVIIEGGGIDADLETVIEFFTNAGFQEVEK